MDPFLILVARGGYLSGLFIFVTELVCCDFFDFYWFDKHVVTVRLGVGWLSLGFACFYYFMF